MIDDVGLCAKTLEWAAQKIEEADFSDFRGILAKKKREREDAELRASVRQEQRTEIGRLLRAFQNREDLSPPAILRRIISATPAGHVVLLHDAWPLAWKGLVTITAHLNVADNTIPPEIAYTIELTEDGKEMLRRTAP